MGVKLIDFHAEWCGPCDVQEPILEDVVEHWNDNDTVTFDTVDVDEEQDIASKHTVRSIPTIIVGQEDDDGFAEVQRFVGVTDEDKINEAIEEALNG